MYYILHNKTDSTRVFFVVLIDIDTTIMQFNQLSNCNNGKSNIVTTISVYQT